MEVARGMVEVVKLDERVDAGEAAGFSLLPAVHTELDDLRASSCVKG